MVEDDAERHENGDAKEHHDESKSKDGLPPNMKFSRAASYNNPHEMFPSASKLFSGMNSVAGNVTKTSNKKVSNAGKISALETVGEDGKLNQSI